jgi:hypothetical protein
LKQSHKTILLWILLIGVFFLLYNLFAEGGDSKEVPFFQLLTDIEQKRVSAEDGIVVDLKSNRYDYAVTEVRDGKPVKVRLHALGLAASRSRSATSAARIRASGRACWCPGCRCC